jgi:hypothetical protein
MFSTIESVVNHGKSTAPRSLTIAISGSTGESENSKQKTQTTSKRKIKETTKNRGLLIVVSSEG